MKQVEAQKFYSNGKLLLTGEYVVLDGAFALAVPTTYGQYLSIEPSSSGHLCWKSIDELGNAWFEDKVMLEDISKHSLEDESIRGRILQILNTCQKLNPHFLRDTQGAIITTQLDFPRQWGLGTSSTLINNMAQWAEIDAYELLDRTFGGSGYDIACAQYNSAIRYQLQYGRPTIINVDFDPAFKDHLYFVYLNKKQNSRDGIANYNKVKTNVQSVCMEISAITNDLISCDTLEAFQFLMESHENIISKTIGLPTVKEQFFMDFKGSIKSLGAWGGDFVLVASEEAPQDYFQSRGYDTVIPYSKMVL